MNIPTDQRKQLLLSWNKHFRSPFHPLVILGQFGAGKGVVQILKHKRSVSPSMKAQRTEYQKSIHLQKVMTPPGVSLSCLSL